MSSQWASNFIQCEQIAAQELCKIEMKVRKQKFISILLEPYTRNHLHLEVHSSEYKYI